MSKRTPDRLPDNTHRRRTRFMSNVTPTISAGTLSTVAADPSASRASTAATVQDAEMTDRRQASKRARVAVRTKILTPAALGRMNPTMRMCWSPQMPFPPILDTTLEEVTQRYLHPACQQSGVGSYTSAGTDFDHDSYVIGIECNHFTSFNTLPNHTLGGALDNADTNAQAFPHQHPPNNWMLFSTYKRAAVVASRLAITIECPDSTVEPTEWVAVLKKCPESENPTNKDSTGTGWGALNFQPSATSHGILPWKDYRAYARGTFLERAPLFEDNLIMAKIKSPSTMIKAPPKTVLHSHWSLHGDEGVPFDALLQTTLSRNDVDHAGATRDATDFEPFGDIWAHSMPDPAVAGINPPVARPKWFFTIVPLNKEEGWSTSSHASLRNGVAITKVGNPALLGPTFKITIKRQYDVHYYEHRLDNAKNRNQPNV